MTLGLPVLDSGDTRRLAAAPAGRCDDAASASPAEPRRVVPQRDREALAAWDAAVGAPIFAPAPSIAGAPAASNRLRLVSWNLRGASGDLDALIDDLRRGAPAEAPAAVPFVLLLQEAVRVGGSVPDPVPPGAASAHALPGPARPERSIEAVAARAGLALFYAPSMRNGAARPEDRGNAILSTLPLSDPVAIDLPLERQRRTAVAAHIALPLPEGGALALRLVSAHFENHAALRRFWRSFGSARSRQVRSLLAALDEEEWVVLGTDLNSWFGGTGEESLALLRERLPEPARTPDAVTYAPPFALGRRQVDFVRARLPAGWQARYRVDPDWRGSDHAPLVGQIERRPTAGAAHPTETLAR